MRRFTIAPERISDDRVVFDAGETRHLARVLRLRPGDEVIAADGRGHAYRVRIVTLGENATGTIVGPAAAAEESGLAITLVQGVPKGTLMETVIRATTELGVSRILPALTARTVVRRDPADWRDRARRWQRIAQPLSVWLDGDDEPDLRLCLWEGGGTPLRRLVDDLTRRPRGVSIVVGPEGGLTAGEVSRARSAGYTVVTLGHRILRTETAAVTAVALVQYTLGDLGGATS